MWSKRWVAVAARSVRRIGVSMRDSDRRGLVFFSVDGAAARQLFARLVLADVLNADALRVADGLVFEPKTASPLYAFPVGRLRPCVGLHLGLAPFPSDH